MTAVSRPPWGCAPLVLGLGIGICGEYNETRHGESDVPRVLHSSNVNDGGMLLVTEARQRFALFDRCSAASLLNEGVNAHLSNGVEVV
jgi:hypothetical protein